MIGDDDVDASTRRLGHRLDRRDAAVHGHDSFRLVLLERAPERRGPEAVAVVQPMRDEGPHVGAQLSGAPS